VEEALAQSAACNAAAGASGSALARLLSLSRAGGPGGVDVSVGAAAAVGGGKAPAGGAAGVASFQVVDASCWGSDSEEEGEGECQGCGGGGRGGAGPIVGPAASHPLRRP
jgi:hypothetical protein